MCPHQNAFVLPTLLPEMSPRTVCFVLNCIILSISKPNGYSGKKIKVAKIQEVQIPICQTEKNSPEFKPEMNQAMSENNTPVVVSCRNSYVCWAGHLPLHRGQTWPQYASPGTEPELWPMLLEKAYAKVGVAVNQN